MLILNFRFSLIFFIIGLVSSSIISQDKADPLDRFSYFLGTWEHHSSSDTISHKYKKVLSGQFLKMSTSAFFYGKKGKVTSHTDEGYISFDQERKKYVFRQFHSEGFTNTYVLDKENSTSNYYVWITEHVENGFGLKAMLTVEIKNKNEYFMILHLGKEVENLTACQWINAKRKL